MSISIVRKRNGKKTHLSPVSDDGGSRSIIDGAIVVTGFRIVVSNNKYLLSGGACMISSDLPKYYATDKRL